MSSHKPRHQKQTKTPPPKKVAEPTPPPPPKPNIKITIINAELHENVEEGGTKMDPYVQFKYLVAEREAFVTKTKVDMDAGRTPKWDQEFEFILDDLAGDLYFEMWEWDRNSSDDYLAVGKINMQSALQYQGKPFALDLIRHEKSSINSIIEGFGPLYLRIEQMKRDKTEQEKYEEMLQDERVVKFTKYMQETGLERAFKLIFSEILSKRIDRNEMFLYTALRLRQIGNDLKPLINRPTNLSSILANISEVKQDEALGEVPAHLTEPQNIEEQKHNG